MIYSFGCRKSKCETRNNNVSVGNETSEHYTVHDPSQSDMCTKFNLIVDKPFPI